MIAVSLLYFLAITWLDFTGGSELLKCSLEEEKSPGTFVINVMKAANLESNSGSQLSDQIPVSVTRFTLLDVMEGRFFRLESQTGILRTAMRIDRERLCQDPSVKMCCKGSEKASETCILQCAVAVAGPGDVIQQYIVAVTVVDINDHEPSFSQESRTLHLPEDVSIGHVEYFDVFDPDAGDNGFVRARLSASDATVSTIFQVKRIHSKRIGLSTLMRLDSKQQIISSTQRERRFYMQILAIDGGSPARTGTLSLTVEILDVNNNAPQWVVGETQLHFTIREDTKVTSIIGKLEAKDDDQGRNAQIQYGLDQARASQNRYINYFFVDPNSGEIQLLSSLDYETDQHLIELPVFARDSGETVIHTISATVTIELLDVNDNSPLVTVASFHGDREISVMENKPEGQSIATIFVSDPDTKEGGKITCRVNTADFELKLSQTQLTQSYTLTTLRTFDRERQSIYIFSLTCQDRGEPRLSSELSITVHILDVNDNTPVIHPSPIHVNIMENNRLRERILQMNATDADSGMNARLHYWVPDNVKHLCEISSDTGVLWATLGFDREQKSQYTIPVFVRDEGGQNSNTASTTVSITILDENDHEPRFTGLFFFVVPENAQPNHEIGLVQAVDEDSDENGLVTYFLSQFSNEFQVHSQTGQLTLKHVSLDREKTESYELIVIAQDNGRPHPKSSRTTVHISVEDVNDESPRWIYPSRNFTYFNVSCEESANHVITQVRAHDADRGLNAEVDYTLESVTLFQRNSPPSLKSNAEKEDDEKKLDSNQAYFDIDQRGGQITLLQSFTPCQDLLREYRLVVRARDRGAIPNLATIILSIRVVPHLLKSPSLKDPIRPGSWHENPDADGKGIDANARWTQPRLWPAIIGLILATLFMVMLLLVVIFLLRKRIFSPNPSKATLQRGEMTHVLSSKISENDGHKRMINSCEMDAHGMYASGGSDAGGDGGHPCFIRTYQTLQTTPGTLHKKKGVDDNVSGGMAPDDDTNYHHVYHTSSLNQSNTHINSNSPSNHLSSLTSHSSHRIHFPIYEEDPTMNPYTNKIRPTSRNRHNLSNTAAAPTPPSSLSSSTAANQEKYSQLTYNQSVRDWPIYQSSMSPLLMDNSNQFIPHHSSFHGTLMHPTTAATAANHTMSNQSKHNDKSDEETIFFSSINKRLPKSCSAQEVKTSSTSSMFEANSSSSKLRPSHLVNMKSPYSSVSFV